jgi:hypothetical protein
MERFYDVTVDGQPMRLELHSTSVTHENGRVRITIHPDTSALTDTLPADLTLQFGAGGQAARTALESVSVSYLYPDQPYEEVMRRREIAQDSPLH